MKYPTPSHPRSLYLVAGFVLLIAGSRVHSQAVEPEIHSLARGVPFEMDAGSRDISVTWTDDDTLALDPPWADFADPAIYLRMKLPPRVRSTVSGNFLNGDFLKTDGTWQRYFSLPWYEETSSNSRRAAVPRVQTKAAAPPAPSLSNGNFTTIGSGSWIERPNNKDYLGGKFQYKLTTVDGWTAYRGTAIEVWHGGDGQGSFIELDATKGSYGVKQPIKNAVAGGYVLTWKELGRNNPASNTNKYHVIIYYLSQGKEFPIAKLTPSRNASTSVWKVTGFAFSITKDQFTAAAGAPIHVAFIPEDNNAYGCLLDDVKISPVEFEIKHIEKERDADGNETNTVVNPGLDTMLRDEIVDIRIKVPPIGIADSTIDLSIVPEAMRIKNLPGRGDVKMYDFGELDDKGTPSTKDDMVYPDKTQFVLKASDEGVRTIRAVFNKEGKLKIKMKTSDGKIDFTSPEYTIKERTRKYAIPYPGFPKHDPNKYDQQFVDAADHWGAFYKNPIDTVDRLKAISVAESNVGAFVQNSKLRPHDILTIGNPIDGGLETIKGTKPQWDLDLNHPKKPAGDPRYRKISYPKANIDSTREAIKWGTLWLYVKAFAQSPPKWTGITHRTIKANPNFTYAKRNLKPLQVIDGIEEPENQFVNWHTWDDATTLYNSGGDKNNPAKVEHAFRKGQHYYKSKKPPYKETKLPLWPIRSDKSGRP